MTEDTPTDGCCGYCEQEKALLVRVWWLGTLYWLCSQCLLRLGDPR